MGAREDFMTVRRAAQVLAAQQVLTPVEVAVGKVLGAASEREIHFIRLRKQRAQGEIVDLAYAVLGEQRPDGPASDWVPVKEREGEQG